MTTTIDRIHPTTTTTVPGRGLGVAGFVLSFLGALSPLGLALSIVSLVQAHRSGHRNALALAGTIIGGIGTIVLVAVAVYAVSTLASSTEVCSIGQLVDLRCR